MLRDKLRAFEDIAITTHNYETAAEMFNTCRSKEIQGSHTDFLICAVAKNYNLSIFATDNEFEYYKKHLSINIYSAL